MGIVQRLSGQRGRVRVGFRTAAEIGPYTLTVQAPGEWSVEGAVVSADPFLLTQSPKALEVEVGAQRWLWQTTSLAVDARTVTGTVSGHPSRR